MTLFTFFQFIFKAPTTSQPLGLVASDMGTLQPHDYFKYSRQKDLYLVDLLSTQIKNSSSDWGRREFTWWKIHSFIITFMYKMPSSILLLLTHIVFKNCNSFYWLFSRKIVTYRYPPSLPLYTYENALTLKWSTPPRMTSPLGFYCHRVERCFTLSLRKHR